MGLEMLYCEDQPDEKEALRQYSLKFGECRDGTDSGNLALFRAMYFIQSLISCNRKPRQKSAFSSLLYLPDCVKS